MPHTALAPGARESPRVLEALAAAHDVTGFGTDPRSTLEWCVDVGKWAPRVGEGGTGELWELLAATAAWDVSAARMLEPHLDALSILAQAGDDSDLSVLESPPSGESTWGVFAAESADRRLHAVRGAQGWTLRGTKPWCSLASHLTHALVTASDDDGQRRLFAVDLHSPGVHPHAGPWIARGLADVVSAPVQFDEVPAVPVGAAGWYLTRPGFAWGGMSVAACWWGAAVGLAERLVAPAAADGADQLALVHLGRADASLWAARAVLAEAAGVIDDGLSSTVGERRLAQRVRATVVDAATAVLADLDAALGPAPLVADESYARRVADLHLYLRQHHGLRDIARLGRDVADARST